jgi:hypothetical protein
MFVLQTWRTLPKDAMVDIACFILILKWLVGLTRSRFFKARTLSGFYFDHSNLYFKLFWLWLAVIPILSKTFSIVNKLQKKGTPL